MFPIRSNLKERNKKFRILGGSRYSSKKYTNPFFEKNNKRNKTSSFNDSFLIKTKLASLIIFIVMISIFSLVLYSNYFTIKNIEANGEGRVSSEQIKDLAWKQIENSFFVLFPQKNIFVFSKNSLSEKLNSKYSFEWVKIEKDIPATIIISYKEKENSLIWFEDDKFYYCDIHGGIISEANILEIQQKDYPIIKNKSSKKIDNNFIPINQDMIKYAIQLFSEFKNYENFFNVNDFIIDEDANTIKANLENGPTVYFNSEVSIDKQLNKLVTVKNEILKMDFNQKSYIDVRIGESVYYR